MAAAIAVNVSTSTAQATIPDSTTIHAGGLLSLAAANTTDGETSANASAATSQTAIGAAVAINDVHSTAYATIGANSTLSAQGLSLTALMNTPIAPTNTFDSTAVSGAGGQKIGIAGSVAFNYVNNISTASLGSGDSITLSTGDVTINAKDDSSTSASATPSVASSGSSVGVGASIALNIVTNTVTAEVPDTAAISGGATMSVSGEATETVYTYAQNGAAGGVGVGASIALAIVNDTTTAYVGSGQALDLSGGLGISANQNNTETSIAPANAQSSKVGVGAAIALNIVTDASSAKLERNVQAGGSIGVTSFATTTSTTEARVAELGIPLPSQTPGADSETSNQESYYGVSSGQQAPSAQSEVNSASSQTSSNSDSGGLSSVGVAAAIAVNYAKASSDAEVGANLQVDSSGSLTVESTETAVGYAKTTSLALLNTNSIGAAVSLNIFTVNNTATIGQGALVNAIGVSVEALMYNNEPDAFWVLAASAGVGSEVSVAGSIAVNVINTTVAASIGDRANIDSTGNLSVESQNFMLLQNAVGGASFSGENGVGAGIAFNYVNNSTTATIGDNVTADSADALAVTADSSELPFTNQIANGPTPLTFTLPGQSHSTSISDIAVGVAGSGDNSASGSVIVNLYSVTTAASIGNSDLINTRETGNLDQSIAVEASDALTIADGAGVIAAGGSNGIGVAIDLNVFTNYAVSATIGSGSTLNARSNATITAGTTDSFTGLIASANVGGSAAIGGSVVVDIFSPTTTASISPNTSVDAGGSVVVAAAHSTTILNIAGNFGGSGDASVGIANSTVVETDSTTAFIGSGDVVIANGVDSYQTGFGDINGVAVAATSSDNLTAWTVAGAFSGSASVAGSATINVLTANTTAYIDQGAEINATSSTGGTPSVLVLASDPTSIYGIAGSLSIGGDAGVGAGFDVGVLTKTTAAYILTAMVSATGDVIVQAVSGESMLSLAGGGAGGVYAGISGEASIYILAIKTYSTIGADPLPGAPTPSGAADVQASGSVGVSAVDPISYLGLAGELSAGAGAFGAAVGIPIVSQDTEAYIAGGSTVTALGSGSGVTAYTGQYTVTTNQSYASPYNDSGAEATPGTTRTNATSSVPGLTDQLNNPRLSNKRTATPNTTTINGLAVSAESQNDLETVGISAGAGGISFGVGGAINITSSTTYAYIGPGSKINTVGDTGASPGQTVFVASGHDYSNLGMALNVQFSGSIGAAPGVNAAIDSSDVEAYIADGAQTAAAQNVLVQAHNSEDLLAITAGVAAATLGFGAALGYLSINDTTHAYIGNTGAGGPAVVNAGGSVSVAADDETNTWSLAGSLAAGAELGLGASVTFVDVQKDTQAFIGQSAQITALGGTGSQLNGIYNGVLDSNGQFDVQNGFVGIAVQASSRENVVNLAAAIGVGGVGIAGGVSVEIVSSNTTASIGNNASINQQDQSGSPTQGVDVAAVNSSSALAFGGGLAVGAAGVSGAVDVGMIRNNTTAVIGASSTVNAAGQVGVFALSNKVINSYAIDISGGVVGVAGSVSVWTLGEPFSPNYTGVNQSNGGGMSQSAQNNLASSLTPSGGSSTMQSDMNGGLTSFTNQLSYNQGGSSDGHANSNTSQMTSQTGKASGDVSNDSPNNQYNSAYTSTAVTGTTAYIGANAIVTAGSVDIQARENRLQRHRRHRLPGIGRAGRIGRRREHQQQHQGLYRFERDDQYDWGDHRSRGSGRFGTRFVLRRQRRLRQPERTGRLDHRFDGSASLHRIRGLDPAGWEHFDLGDRESNGVQINVDRHHGRSLRRGSEHRFGPGHGQHLRGHWRRRPDRSELDWSCGGNHGLRRRFDIERGHSGQCHSARGCSL